MFCRVWALSWTDSLHYYSDTSYQINEMLFRMDNFLKVLAIAREEANSIEVEELTVAELILE